MNKKAVAKELIAVAKTVLAFNSQYEMGREVNGVWIRQNYPLDAISIIPEYIKHVVRTAKRTSDWVNGHARQIAKITGVNPTVLSSLEDVYLKTLWNETTSYVSVEVFFSEKEIREKELTVDEFIGIIEKNTAYRLK